MNFYKRYAEKFYFEAISLRTNIPRDLKDALKTNERVPLFVDNLAIEFKKVQDLRLRQNKKQFDIKTFQDMVYDYVDWFIEGLESEAKKRFESDMSRVQREQKQKEIDDLNKTINGNPSGDYEEFGLISESEINKNES